MWFLLLLSFIRAIITLVTSPKSLPLISTSFSIVTACAFNGYFSASYFQILKIWNSKSVIDCHHFAFKSSKTCLWALLLIVLSLAHNMANIKTFSGLVHSRFVSMFAIAFILLTTAFDDSRDENIKVFCVFSLKNHHQQFRESTIRPSNSYFPNLFVTEHDPRFRVLNS
jgi:hypothetical protein